MEYTGMKEEKLYKFWMPMLFCEEALEGEEKCTLWNSMVNYAVAVIVEYSGKDLQESLRIYLDQEKNVAYGQGPAAMEVWLGACHCGLTGRKVS